MKLRKIFACFMAAVCVLSMAGCNNTSGNEEETKKVIVSGDGQTQESTESVGESTGQASTKDEVVLNFWYTDAAMTEYFTEAVEKYKETKPNVVINLNVAASTGYLENINTQSIKQTNAVDIYMIHNAELEEAYLAGLANAYNPDGTVFTKENYGESAIRAVTYKDKQVAYPLYFDSAFLVYNKAYVTEVPATFEGIKQFSNDLEYSEEGSITDNIEKTFVWPVSDYTFNYPFLSDSFVVGGLNGDDRTQINVNNDTVVAALEYFHGLYDFFAIDREEENYESCIKSFLEGKIAFTLAKTGALPQLNEAKVEYGTACMPDISDSISASSLSYTQALVINPYSLNIEEAQAFVKALTYDYVGSFYEKTGYYPSCKAWSYDDIAAGVYANYSDSTPRPKMMTLGDYYIHLEILLHSVWDDNGEITELLAELHNFLTTQVN